MRKLRHALVFLALVECVVAQSPAWSALSDDVRPPPVEAFGHTRAGGALWRFGGLGIDRGSIVIRNDLWRLDLNASRWLPVDVRGPAPPARTRTCMIAWEHPVTGSLHLLIAAGRYAISSQPESTYRDYNDVWSFDTSTNSSSWTLVSPGGGGAMFPGPRSGHGCGRRGDYLLLFGGSTWQNGLYADTWAFHIPTAEWQLVQTTRTGPPPSFAVNTAYIPPVTLLTTDSPGAGFTGDAFVVQGGRTAGTTAFSPLSTVLAETYILVFGPPGRPDGNSTVPVPYPSPPAQLTAVWYLLTPTTQVRAGVPPRAFAAPFLVVRNSSISFCLHGGAEGVAYGDRLTSDTLCVDLTQALDWARRLSSRQETRQGSRALQAQASAQIVWYVLTISGRSSVPVSRQRHAAFLLPSSYALASSMPTLMVHAGSSMDTILSDTWSIPIPSLPAPGTAGAPWTVYTPPAAGYDWITVQWVALSGFGLLVLFTMVLLLMRKMNERYRLRALERSIAAEHARELALMHALDSMGWRARAWEEGGLGGGSLSRVQPEGAREVQGLPQEIIEQLPTFKFSHEKSCVPEGKNEEHACTLGRGTGGRGEAEGQLLAAASTSVTAPSVGRAFDADTQTSCMICLSEFQEGELVTMLPCCHHFHGKPCLTAWLLGHRTCPLCKLDVADAVVP